VQHRATTFQCASPTHMPDTLREYGHNGRLREESYPNAVHKHGHTVTSTHTPAPGICYFRFVLQVAIIILMICLPFLLSLCVWQRDGKNATTIGEMPMPVPLPLPTPLSSPSSQMPTCSNRRPDPRALQHVYLRGTNATKNCHRNCRRQGP